MSASRFCLIARFSKAHGLQGEITAVPAGDLISIEALASALENLQTIFVVPPPYMPNELSISKVRPVDKGLLVTFKGVDSRDAASDLCGSYMLARIEDLPEAVFSQGEEHTEDSREGLLGLEVCDREKGSLGQVEEVLVTGANDVLVVQGDFGEVLIPVIDDVILDISESRIDIRLLEGLLDNDDNSEGEKA